MTLTWLNLATRKSTVLSYYKRVLMTFDILTILSSYAHKKNSSIMLFRIF